MVGNISKAVEPLIIKRYAVSSTILFFVMAFVASLDNTLSELISGGFVAEMESVSYLLLCLVLISSIAGMLFHHMISLQTAARNSFACVFSFTSLKLLGALVIFQSLPI